MSDVTPITVTTNDQHQGIIVQPAELSEGGEPKVLVQFDDGQEFYVLTDLLLEQESGNFDLPISFDELQRRQTDLA